MGIGLNVVGQLCCWCWQHNQPRINGNQLSNLLKAHIHSRQHIFKHLQALNSICRLQQANNTNSMHSTGIYKHLQAHLLAQAGLLAISRFHNHQQAISRIGRNSLTYERIMHTRIKTKRQKLKPYKCNGFVGIYK